MHRWLKWAISQNIIDPADYFMPIRYLKVISPLKGRNESVVNVPNKYNVEENSVSLKVIQQPNKSAWKTKPQKILDPSITKKEESTEDFGEWIDFIKLAPYVIEVHLFYKLEYFQCSIQVIGDNILKMDKDRKAVKDTKEVKKEKEGIITYMITAVISTCKYIHFIKALIFSEYYNKNLDL